MNTHYALVAAAGLFFTVAGRAQVHNALACDGIDDKVTVPGASALLVGGTGISLTCWAYPTNAATGFPDFDGFAGMRDEFSADFYLLQVAPSNTLEARFRNSQGQFFTLEYSGLQLNAWQFLVFTYDGSQLTIYANGVNVATAPANGNIDNTMVDLLIGDVLYQGTDFYLNGRVDEVSLWNRGLSQSEVNCMYTNGVDVNATGLKLYYKMDQGIGGGNNAGITALTPSKGAISGQLSGFALNGSSSNFVESPVVGNNISAALCPGEVYTFHGQPLQQAGVYGAAYDVGEVCDSLVTLTLNYTAVNVQVSQAGGMLTSQAAGAVWQWLDCGAGLQAVPGATSQTFMPALSGSYAVQVTQNNCTDTSTCINVALAGIAQPSAPLAVRIFPDPATDQVHIDLGLASTGGELVLYDANGRELMRRIYGATATINFSVAQLDAGLYFIHLRTAEGGGVYRLVKH